MSIPITNEGEPIARLRRIIENESYFTSFTLSMPTFTASMFNGMSL